MIAGRQIFYKCVDYIGDPATREDAIKIMAAKAGADPDEYAKNVPGTHFLSLAEAKKTFQKGEGLDSIYGSMAIGNQFNLENKVYKESQKPSSYLAPSIVEGL
jgi:NitT/TauT family transport system substrate-binding protein